VVWGVMRGVLVVPLGAGVGALDLLG